MTIPNEAFAALLRLFESYNFTVTESTPFDIEVAVDPEMLGKVFEELVTGRHETGSYHTPRPIVSFMCRESLKHYLVTATPVGQIAKSVEEPGDRFGNLSYEAVERFVDDGDPSHLPDPEAVLNALKGVKVCDPACGSGAYLLGTMLELRRLRDLLFSKHQVDAVTVYQRKLEIIQTNLHGVDLDPFATNIAMLRLWLSLAVDFEGEMPEPLPNLLRGGRFEFYTALVETLPIPDAPKAERTAVAELAQGAQRLHTKRRDRVEQFLRAIGTSAAESSSRNPRLGKHIGAALKSAMTVAIRRGLVEYDPGDREQVRMVGSHDHASTSKESVVPGGSK